MTQDRALYRAMVERMLAGEDNWRGDYRRRNNEGRAAYDPAQARLDSENRNSQRDDVIRRNMVSQLRKWGVPEFTIDNLVSAAEWTPLVGDAMDVQDAGRMAARAWEDPTWGNIGGAGLMGAAALASIVPGGGDAAKKGLKGLAKEIAEEGAEKVAKKAAKKAKKKAPRKTSAGLTRIRDLPADEAIAEARKGKHLIRAPKGSKSYYVGGPETVQSPQALGNVRRKVDQSIEAGAEGGKWYDITRENLERVAGPNPRDQRFMAGSNAQYSAGVSPEGELGFSLKDTNNMIAFGDPGKPARPAQAAASIRAAEALDPNQFQLAKKTGQYYYQIDPSVGRYLDDLTLTGAPSIGHNGGPPLESLRTPHATGVNDRWHARGWGYSSEGQHPITEHNFMDYETALSVDRANQKALAGRQDWTGEQVQAASWVQSRAEEYFRENPGKFMDDARKALGLKAITPDNEAAVENLARQLAFEKSNVTIADFIPKHRAAMTYEYQPYVDAGHLPGLTGAPMNERRAYAEAAQQGATDSMGRDRLYAGMRYWNRAGQPTGHAMRVDTTLPMQGVYTPPGGKMETNPGYVARPLVAFNIGPDKEKSMDRGSKALVDGVESVRGWLDVQGAAAGNKSWRPQANKNANAVMLSRDPGVASLEEIVNAGKVGERVNMPNVVDTGEGLLVTNFDGGGTMNNLTPAQQKKLMAEMAAQAPGTTPSQVINEGVYRGYEGTWEQGIGSDAATKKMLADLDALPAATQEAIYRNPEIPQRAGERADMDDVWGVNYGGARKDVQYARRLVQKAGPNWRRALEDALGKGLLPAAAVAAVMSEVLSDAGITTEQSSAGDL